MKAECERRLYVAAADTFGADVPRRRDLQILREAGPMAPLDDQGAVLLLQPVVGYPFKHLLVIVGPRVRLADVEQARFKGGIHQPLLKVPCADNLVAVGFDGPFDTVVFLSALPAEDEGEQDFVAAARHELLPVERDEPLTFGFQRGVHALTPADELVQLEGEGPLCRRLAGGEPVAGEKVGLDGAAALLRGKACQFAKPLGRSVATADADRLGAQQASAGIAGQAEGVFDPARERMSEEGIYAVEPVRFVSAGEVADCGERGGAAEIGIRSRSLQRLGDYVLRPNGPPEELRRDCRHLALLLFDAPASGDGRRRSDALQIVRLELVLDAPHKQRDVGSLAPAVGVELVEHEKTEVVGLADELLLVDAREEELEHDVVGQEDVGRAGDDLLALLGRLLPGVDGEGHGGLAIGVAVAEELPQLADLGVGERVHRVDDDGLDAFAFAVPQDIVHDGDDVGEALSGTGARSQKKAVAGPGGLDGIELVAVQAQQLPG